MFEYRVKIVHSHSELCRKMLSLLDVLIKLERLQKELYEKMYRVDWAGLAADVNYLLLAAAG